MPSKLNKYIYEELQSRFESADHCVVMSFTGMSAAQMTTLRSLVRKEDGAIMVIKNSIAKRAFSGLGCDDAFVNMLEGSVAVAYGGDAAALIRTITDWNKKAKKIEFKGGMLQKRAINPAMVSHLATLPPLPVMQGMALGAIAAPLTSFLGVCNEIMRSFIRVVDQLAEKQGGSAAVAE